MGQTVVDTGGHEAELVADVVAGSLKAFRKDTLGLVQCIDGILYPWFQFGIDIDSAVIGYLLLWPSVSAKLSSCKTHYSPFKSEYGHRMAVFH